MASTMQPVAPAGLLLVLLCVPAGVAYADNYASGGSNGTSVDVVSSSASTGGSHPAVAGSDGTGFNEAFGLMATANGGNATALGDNATANGLNAAAFGRAASASAGNAVAYGGNATASGADAAAIGGTAQATGEGAVALGGGAWPAAWARLRWEKAASLPPAPGRARAPAVMVSPGPLRWGCRRQRHRTPPRSAGARRQAIRALHWAAARTRRARAWRWAWGRRPRARAWWRWGAGSTAAGLANVVSVGSATQQRQIINVALREVSATSTDAVNGGQLDAAEKLARPADWPDGRSARKTDDASLVDEIRMLVLACRATAIDASGACCEASGKLQFSAPVNVKRVYRVMRLHDLLLHRRPTRLRIERRHDGKVAVPRSNQRWCSDGFEFRCDNGEPLRVTFALDCCDREAMSWAATTGGHSGDVVRDVMLAAVEHRFGNVRKAPVQIEWLSDNGSGYIADKTRAFASDIGLKPLTTPVCSPQSKE
jgi:putative transposase